METKRIRIYLHIGVIAFLLFLIIRKIPLVTHSAILMVLLPYVFVNFMDIYFLIKALFNNPKAVDQRFSSALISLIVTCHSGFLIFLSTNPRANEILSLNAARINTLLIVFIVWALLSLRSNLSVLPEANQIVRHGPYRFIRHPLYFAYIIMAIDEILIYQTWIICILSTLQIWLILIRAAREEKILSVHIPEYRNYSKDTFWFNGIFRA